MAANRAPKRIVKQAQRPVVEPDEELENEDMPENEDIPEEYEDELAEEAGEPTGSDVLERTLTFDDIMAAKDLDEETVPVEQWGGSVKLRTLTKGEFDTILKRSTDGNGDRDPITFKDLVLIASMVEPRLTLQQLEQLKGKSAAPLLNLTMAALRLSGLTDMVGEETPQGMHEAEVKSFRR